MKGASAMDTDSRSEAMTVLVTGAAGNLGRAVAKAFSERGHNLVLIARRREDLVAAFADEAANRAFAAIDLLDPRQVGESVAWAQRRFQRVDVLCTPVPPQAAAPLSGAPQVEQRGMPSGSA